MQRYLVFSDSHGDISRCKEIIDSFEYRVSGIIHAGDYAGDAQDLKAVYPDIPVYYVCGNTDLFTTAPVENVFVLDGIKVFLTHGHTYRVKQEARGGYETLAKRAEELEADLCVFGHTHYQDTVYTKGMTLLNPGSVRYSGTYSVVEIENGKVKTIQKDAYKYIGDFFEQNV